MKTRNYVAKNLIRAGQGAHVIKDGNKAPRHKQKQKFKKELKSLEF